MKHIGKRILSIILSAVMVVSMLPVFAINALADSTIDGNSSFMTDSTMDNMTGTATWNSSVNAWEFDGSKYLKLNGNPLANSTVENGFSISFDVYHNDIDEAASYYFFFTNGGNNSFHMKAGDASAWWERYITRFRYNGTDRNYYTSDFDSSEYCDPTGKKMNDLISENQWYNIRITMENDGCFAYYIDGILTAKFRNNYASLGNGHGVTDAQVNTVVQSLNNLVIGAENTNGANGFRGYIRNFRFNSLGNDADSNYEAALEYYRSEIDALRIGTSKGDAYNGLGDVYDAYVDLNKAYDAYKYGGNTSVDIGAKAMDLLIAGDSVTKYASTKGTAKVGWENSDGGVYGGIDESNNDNVLYADPVINWNVYQLATGVQGNVRTYIYYPNNLALQYDGITTLLIPVSFGADKDTGDTRYVYGVYPTKSDSDATDSTDFALVGYWWAGNDWSTDYNWGWHQWMKTQISEAEYSKAGYNYATGNAGGSSLGTYKTANLYNQNNANHYWNIMKFIGTPTATMTDYRPTWIRTSGDDSTKTSYTIANRGDDYNHIYVFNLAKVRETVSDYQSALLNLNIDDYTEGGLSDLYGSSAIENALALTNLNGYFTSGTFAEMRTAAKNALDNAVNGVSALTTDFASVSDSNYDNIRSYLTDGLSKSFDSFGTLTAAQLYANPSAYSSTILYYSTFAEKYAAAVSHMNSLATGDYNTATASTIASELFDAFDELEEKGAEAPTVTGESWLGLNNTISVKNNDAETVDIKYSIAYDGGSAGAVQTISDVAANENATISVFTDSTHSTATVKVYAVKNNKNSLRVSSSYNFLAAPSISVENNTVLTEDDAVTFASNNAGAGGIVYYSYNNSDWFVPTSGGNYVFRENYSAVQDIYAKEVKGTSTSEAAHISVLRKASFTIYTNNSKGNNLYDENTKIFIEDTINYSDNIIYTLKVDGVVYGLTHTYDKTNKIDLSQNNAIANAIKNAEYVEITAYAAPHGELIGSNSTLCASAMLISAAVGDDSLVYQESFDDAAVSGKNFTSSNGNGVLGSGSTGVEVIERWDSDSGTGADGNGNVNGLRRNVLKLSKAEGHANENKVILNTNPLNNPADRAYAKSRGVTISFWRALAEDDTTDWMPGVAFIGEDKDGADENSKYYYLEINAAGTLSFNNGNVGSNGKPYIDIMLNKNDPTTHATGTQNKAWVNFTVTIDPNSGIKYYVNGKEYLTHTSYYHGGEEFRKSYNYDTAGTNENGNHRLDYINDGAMARDVLDLITSGEVKFEIGGGDVYNSNYCDTYIDDVRVYNDVLTQVDVNNMFADEFTDAYKAGVTNKLSTSHDPTNVTCYTLTEAVEGKAAGSQVGIEFIEYYNVPSSKYTVDYYSFGTDMTLYHSNDNVNWTVLGDDEGRCGYQNRKLYNGVYTEILEEQFEWCRTNADNASTSQTGAGYLQWAPHVMYNLTINKWCYYGSTSDWGSARSCIFMGTSDNIEGPYINIQTIFKSGGGYGVSDSSTPANAIDSCVYYGHNSDGTINKNELYCSYGSWGPNYVLTLNADGSYAKSWGDSGYAGTCVFNTFDEGSSGWSGEGNYVVYENGYYYFYITLGHNGGNYQQRVFKSTSPTSGFVAINGNDALNNSGEAAPHGNPLITAYYLEGNEYAYTSVGHNSIYKAFNKNNELVTINATHTRPFATTAYSGGAVSMVDGALATRQIDHRGNLAIHNMVAYSKNGWPVALPLTYNGDDTTNFKATATDLQGTYAGNALMAIVDYNYSRATDIVLTATSATEGYIKYGKYAYDFELEYGKDYNNNDITYLNLVDADGDIIGEGVIAKQGDTYEFAFVDARTARHSWGYKKSASIPSQAEIISEVSTMPSAQTFNATAYHEGNPATNAYSNVLYSSGDSSWSGSNSYNNSYIVIADQNMKIAMPRLIVMVYDGDHDAFSPVLYEHKRSGSHTTNTKYIYPNDSDYILKDYWYGYTTVYNDWPGNSKNSTSNNAYFGYNTESVHQTNNSNTDETRFFWNKLYYNGTGDTKKYYTRTYRQTFTAMGYTDNSRTDVTGTIYSNNTQIVINYKPLYNILNGTTKVAGTDLTVSQAYQETLNNPDKYTTSSVRNLYKAMQIIKSVDLNDYEYWSNPENAAKEAACAVKAAVEAFEAVNLQQRASFAQLDSTYSNADSILKGMNGNLQPIYTASSLGALKGAAEDAEPTYSLTEAQREDTPASEQDTIDGYAEDINEALAALETVPAGEVETFTELIKTTTQAVDKDAYSISQSDLDETVAAAASAISTTVEYTSADGSTSSISVIADDADSAAVRSATEAIMSVLTLNVKMYEITLEGSNSRIVGFSGNGTSAEVGTKQYATFNTIANFESDDANTAWYMEYKSETAERGMQYQAYGKTFSTRVLGDITVKAVNAETNSEKPYKVSIQRVYSDKDGVVPVQSIEFAGGTYTLPEAPAILGYTFSSYTIEEDKGATPATISGNTLSGITGEIQIAANYTRNEGEETYSVKIYGTDNATEIYSGTHKYNDKITVSADNAYAYVERIGNTDSYRPYFIGSDLSFYVSESIELRAVNASQYAQLELTTLPAININQSNARTIDVSGKNKTYFNGQIVPSTAQGVQIVEYGFLIGVEKPEGTLNKEDVVIENAGDNSDYRLIRAKSTKDVGAHQFTIVVNGLSGKIIYRGYIKYQAAGGNVETVYTDTITTII